MALETVKIKHSGEDGYAIINKSDLNDSHELYDSGGKKPRKPVKDAAKDSDKPSS